MRTSRVELLGRTDLESILKHVACDADTTYDMFFFDELSYLKEVPADWERIVIEATGWENIAMPADFLEVCAKLLVRHDSKWDDLPALLVKLLSLRAGYYTFEVVAKYHANNPGELPLDLKRRVREGFDAMPRWKRFVMWLDGPIRTLYLTSK